MKAKNTQGNQGRWETLGNIAITDKKNGNSKTVTGTKGTWEKAKTRSIAMSLYSDNNL